MKTCTNSKTALPAALLASMLLSGCLSQEESPGLETEEEVPAAPSQNSAPLIAGNPQLGITIGGDYSFTPQASDPDGDALSFSITNLPVWASFDSSTGTLSGQPTLADVGVFDAISISVSDGESSMSMPDFSINVSQVALGSVTLTWTPPNQTEDGSALTNLAGYRIYYGTVEGEYDNQVDIDSPAISTIVIDNLVPMRYYFVATAVTANGAESAFTNVAEKVVESPSG